MKATPYVARYSLVVGSFAIDTGGHLGDEDDEGDGGTSSTKVRPGKRK